MTILLLTDENHKALTQEDKKLKVLLEAKGITAFPQKWKESPWPPSDAAIVRSTWDYYLHESEYWNILTLESQKTQLINPLHLLKPNGDKKYLVDLYESRNQEVIETRWFDPSLPLPWPQCVVKPSVSASGYKTRLIQNGSEVVAEDFQDRKYIVQPFESSVVSEGEYSFVFFGGNFSHAVLKKPARNEFRVQEKYGGVNHVYTPRIEEIYWARSFVPSDAVYAQVDWIRDDRSNLKLMELELIEPSLFTESDDMALSRFIAALEGFLHL